MSSPLMKEKIVEEIKKQIDIKKNIDSVLVEIENLKIKLNDLNSKYTFSQTNLHSLCENSTYTQKNMDRYYYISDLPNVVLITKPEIKKTEIIQLSEIK